MPISGSVECQSDRLLQTLEVRARRTSGPGRTRQIRGSRRVTIVSSWAAWSTRTCKTAVRPLRAVRFSYSHGFPKPYGLRGVLHSGMHSGPFVPEYSYLAIVGFHARSPRNAGTEIYVPAYAGKVKNSRHSLHYCRGSETTLAFHLTEPRQSWSGGAWRVVLRQKKLTHLHRIP